MLGTAVHKLTELALRGRFEAEATPPLEEDVRKTWNDLVTQGRQRLEAAWAPADVPEPRLWPNFQLLSIRAIRRAVRVAAEQPAADQPTVLSSQPVHSMAATVVEHEFRDDEIGLRGTPDLVERRAGAARVLDLKTGLRQADPTSDQRRQLLLYAHLVRIRDHRTPDECAIVDGSGQEHPVPVTDDDIDNAVEEASAAVVAYNGTVLQGDVMSLARPSQSACRWCAFRAVCNPYFDARQSDWPGSRGDVHGRVITCERATSSESALTLEARLPAYLAGETVRVSGVPNQVAPSSGAVSVIEADLLGGPKAQRLRWDSTVVALP